MCLWGQVKNIFGGRVRPIRPDGRLPTAMLAMLALVLQMFTSSMGQASDGTWIEICSDFGTSYVQVDLSDGAPAPQKNCPDCKNCALCSAGLAGLLASDRQQGDASYQKADIEPLHAQLTGPAYHRAWPETRGPPAMSAEDTPRVSCAVAATNPVKGGAL